MRVFATVLAVFVSAALGAGQDGGLSTAQFEKILKDDLKLDFEKQNIPGGFVYDLKGTPYFVQYHGGQKFLNFYAQGPSISTEKANEWNVKAIYSRVWTSDKHGQFELPLGFGAGVTPAQVKAYYGHLEKEFGEFKDFLKK